MIPWLRNLVIEIKSKFMRRKVNLGGRMDQPETRNDHNKEEGHGSIGYSADTPLSRPEDDLFGRWSFAQHLADTIASKSDPGSLVISLNGEWGEGKSTVLNFVETALSLRENVIPYRFNPWRFPTEPELLTAFFHGLSDAIGCALPTRKERIGEWVAEYLPAPAAILGRVEIAEEMGKLLSTVRLEELRDRVGSILREEGRIVVVLMDDIDRLEKHEIQATFRLVKLTASFDNVVYILAFDDDVVAEALQERYGTASADAGRRFLEKIVQVPLQLPASS